MAEFGRFHVLSLRQCAAPLAHTRVSILGRKFGLSMDLAAFRKAAVLGFRCGKRVRIGGFFMQ